MAVSTEHIKAGLTESAEVLKNFSSIPANIDAIRKAAEVLISTFNSGGRVFSCGNGGSMCDAMHFAEELSGKFRQSRRPLPALAISDPGHLTCVGNDFGFEQVFSTFVTAHGTKGDVLVAISTSGKSPNVILAAEQAKSKGMKVIALVGQPTTRLEALSDVAVIAVGGKYSDRVQEIHIKVIHILIELVERDMFPENYKS